MRTKEEIDINTDYEKRYGFKTPEKYELVVEKGPKHEIIDLIAEVKKEPKWVTEFRHKALEIFKLKPLPDWGPSLNDLDFDEITYYILPVESKARRWEDLPDEIRKTFEKLGVPQAERELLAGIGAQYESEIVYKRMKEELAKQGVIFTDPDEGLSRYESIFKPWFGKVVPPTDNKFAALNSAFFSGGSFIYIPPGVKVEQPLHTYFRINADNIGQFERTLIIADRGSEVTYIEGCTAPIYINQSLHSAVVEIVVLPGAKVRYITLQNWSKNVYNLVTKRAFVYKNATVEWIDANIGSKITMKYPGIYLLGENSRGEILSVAFAGKGQIQDTGAKVIHSASNTSSRIVSKSVSKDGGRTVYRGLIKVSSRAYNVKANAKCDSLLLDEHSSTNTYPYNQVFNRTATVTHEATVGKISKDKLFYLMSRGFSEDEALSMIVLGFFEPFLKEIPLEYAVEFNRLISLEMSGAVG